MDNGTYKVGAHCKASGCTECNTIAKLHPFGDRRINSIELDE